MSRFTDRWLSMVAAVALYCTTQGWVYSAYLYNVHVRESCCECLDVKYGGIPGAGPQRVNVNYAKFIMT